MRKAIITKLINNNSTMAKTPKKSIDLLIFSKENEEGLTLNCTYNNHKHIKTINK